MESGLSGIAAATAAPRRQRPGRVRRRAAGRTAPGCPSSLRGAFALQTDRSRMPIQKEGL